MSMNQTKSKVNFLTCQQVYLGWFLNFLWEKFWTFTKGCRSSRSLSVHKYWCNKPMRCSECDQILMVSTNLKAHASEHAPAAPLPRLLDESDDHNRDDPVNVGMLQDWSRDFGRWLLSEIMSEMDNRFVRKRRPT